MRLRAESLTKTFGRKQRPGKPGLQVRAVDSVNVSVNAGDFVTIVGESGSGKSTLARMMLGLITPDEGRVSIGGVSIAGTSRKEQFKFRSAVQAVLQDPSGSLNPRKTVRTALAEVARLHGVATNRSDIDAKVRETLSLVGLTPAGTYLDRYPHELSGGQRQRVLIARALIPGPKIIVADEAVSALDVSVKSGILSLMCDLQKRLGIGYLFITHDLTVVKKVADYVYVMQNGRVVEEATPAELFTNPQHDCTRSLLNARLELDDVLQERYTNHEQGPPALSVGH
ncbi:ABC transporter ATP-binding protein [Arthrobacter sp. FW306-2-2C-D06B]|uniref:ABC transporter ATP-binding protein n=1 Tax=Arthrobacter sp. FW306-2-2C-D06B TaxID=2879618 RepID=UPI001F320275|nr:dipeptide/oligopeptide/nickel ABC transporter ATP-binding protein [Arthrobacter sp. FW306-2-2C-D06B]UKA60839.1 dipeptide/oligopeptide/nickel ABC transporter ATP-binding protein [Arthrobacter sp. FW306-2-2C-D06B]